MTDDRPRVREDLFSYLSRTERSGYPASVRRAAWATRKHPEEIDARLRHEVVPEQDGSPRRDYGRMPDWWLLALVVAGVIAAVAWSLMGIL